MSEFEVRGVEEVAATLEAMGRDFQTEGAQIMGRVMYSIWSAVPPYPPEPDDSTYRRTGTLGRTISAEVRPIGTDVVGVIGASVEYAPLVIGRDTQAWMHTGRWWTLQGVVESQQANTVAQIEAWVESVINRRL